MEHGEETVGHPGVDGLPHRLVDRVDTVREDGSVVGIKVGVQPRFFAGKKFGGRAGEMMGHQPPGVEQACLPLARSARGYVQVLGESFHVQLGEVSMPQWVRSSH